VNIPAEIRAGDTVKWRDSAASDNLGNSIDSGSWTLTYYLRTDKANHGAVVVGSAYGAGGWELTISATTSAAFDSGHWYWQAIATKGSEKVTLGAGQLQVFDALSYTGNPGAFDGRTQAHQDLDAVDAAIRAIVSGGVVQEYTIGNRRLKKYDLAELQVLRSRLIAEVKREQAAASIAQGLGNPHNLFVRF
jgi:hypothetical protein